MYFIELNIYLTLFLKCPENSPSWQFPKGVEVELSSRRGVVRPEPSPFLYLAMTEVEERQKEIFSQFRDEKDEGGRGGDRQDDDREKQREGRDEPQAPAQLAHARPDARPDMRRKIPQQEIYLRRTLVALLRRQRSDEARLKGLKEKEERLSALKEAHGVKRARDEPLSASGSTARDASASGEAEPPTKRLRPLAVVPDVPLVPLDLCLP